MHAAHSGLNAREDSVTYFCFIESKILSVPHMEPLLAETEDEAIAEAADLMGLHSSAIAAHVFKDQDRVGTIMADDLSNVASRTPSRMRPSGDTPSS